MSINGFTYSFEVELFENSVEELGRLSISRHRLAASNSCHDNCSEVLRYRKENALNSLKTDEKHCGIEMWRRIGPCITGR